MRKNKNKYYEKIRICQKNEGKILSKSNKKINKEKIEYNWTNIKREKKFPIVYNDKTINIIKKIH